MHGNPGLVILLEVLILFVISVACLVALLGAALAMVRHVRASHRAERAAAPPQPEFREHLESAVRYGTARDLRRIRHQRVESITARKEWNAPSQSVEIHPAGPEKAANEEQAMGGGRKGPQSARRFSASERVDWSHFNKDFGDLTDPQPSRQAQAASDRATSRRRY